MPEDEFEQVLNVNIIGVYRTIRPAIKHVMTNKGHNAGIAALSEYIDLPMEKMEAIMNINLMSVFRLNKMLLKEAVYFAIGFLFASAGIETEISNSGDNTRIILTSFQGQC